MTYPTPHTSRLCASGASLACSGAGLERVQPESMLPGSTPEYLDQCLECYEYAAARYIRVLHLIGEPS